MNKFVVFGAISVFASGCWAAESSAQIKPDAKVAGFILEDLTTGKVPHHAFYLMRDGKRINDTPFLQPCDVLHVLSTPEAPAQVRYTTTRNGRSNTLPEPSGNSKAIIECSTQTVSKAFFSLFSQPSSVKVVPAASRSEGISSSAPLELAIFKGSEFALATGRRALFVPWRGGVGEFKVTLFRASQKTAARVLLVDAHKISRRVVRLPYVNLSPGQYHIEVCGQAAVVEGGDYKCLTEHAINVVVKAATPADVFGTAPKKALTDNEAVAKIDYLMNRDNGKWKFEAYQFAANLSNKPELVQAWMENFGDLP